MRVGEAGNDGAERREIIDVAVAVRIPEISARGAFHEDGSAAAYRFVGAGGAVDTANDVLERFLVQLFGFKVV
ncbi:hypothetical protein D3C73_1317860 [compost metagenome]